MYAISIMTPWPWAIFNAGKDIENRSWRLPHRFRSVDVYVHTGLKPDDPDAWDFIEQVSGKRPPPVAELTLGALVGVVRFTTDVMDSGSPWFGGPHGWVIGAARPLERPIHCRGQLGFWEPDTRAAMPLLVGPRLGQTSIDFRRSGK